MKAILTSVLCLCAVLLFCNGEVSAQASPEMPPIVCFLPFDTYKNIPTEDEEARLDNLAIYLLRDPEQVAYIYVYAGRLTCAGEAELHLKRIAHHLVKTRGIKPDRVILRDGGFREEETVELLLWPRVSEFDPPSATPTIDRSEVKMRKDCRSSSRSRRPPHASRRG